MAENADVAALTKFLAENEELERLEALLSDFNLFAALRLERQEIRHSAFLRWLLDPAETHGLAGYPLKLFLRHAVLDLAADSGTESSLTVFDIDEWDLHSAQVLSEWNRIDILVTDEANRLVCVVENKVDSREHSDQLERYRSLVEQEFAGYTQLYLYLTVDGDRPSDDAYSAISYRDVAATVHQVLERRGGQLGAEVKIFLSQYLEMVRRSLVEDSEIQELCRRIYASHRRALDLILEHRPDKSSEVQEVVLEVLRGIPDFIIDGEAKGLVRFIPKSMDNLVPHEGAGWPGVKSGRMLLFELESGSERLRLKLTLGPGPAAVRDRFLETVRKNPDTFGQLPGRTTPKWTTMKRDTWIEESSFADVDRDEVAKVVRGGLNELLEGFVKQVETLTAVPTAD